MDRNTIMSSRTLEKFRNRGNVHNETLLRYFPEVAWLRNIGSNLTSSIRPIDYHRMFLPREFPKL